MTTDELIRVLRAAVRMDCALLAAHVLNGQFYIDLPDVGAHLLDDPAEFLTWLNAQAYSLDDLHGAHQPKGVGSLSPLVEHWGCAHVYLLRCTTDGAVCGSWVGGLSFHAYVSGDAYDHAGIKPAAARPTA